MMNPHLPAVPPGAPPPQRDRNEYYNPYYHQPYAPGPHQVYQTPYYAPYHPPPQPVPRQHLQAPLVVSSYPHSQPMMPHRQPPPRNLQSTPSPASIPSVQSQPQFTPSTSTSSLAPISPIPTPEPITAIPQNIPSSNSPPIIPEPPAPVTQRQPPVVYFPPLPWYSCDPLDFPPRTQRRRPKSHFDSRTPPLRLPDKTPEVPTPSHSSQASATTDSNRCLETPAPDHISESPPATDATRYPETPAPAHVSESGTPSGVTSEIDSTQPTTPSSTVSPAETLKSPNMPPTTAHKRPFVPAIPIIPAIPRPRASTATTTQSVKSPTIDEAPVSAEAPPPTSEKTPEIVATPRDESPAAPTPKPAPKSWADLVKTPAGKATSVNSDTSKNASLTPNGFPTRTEALAELLSSFSIDENSEVESKISFLEPRGLENAGNMCYLNSVLQVLVFCVPFYNFLDKVARGAAHSFKGDTPLLDAMIILMQQFRVIDSAATAEKLRLRLKDKELEEFGQPLTPKFYDVIRPLPRFSSFERGHQQDAEEFLGFLLDGLHNECANVMKGSRNVSGMSTPTAGSLSPTIDSFISDHGESDAGWHEVGRKQKAAVTRSSGTITTESPITKIFGGKLRSELRVPGKKNSVTLEPYQPLQLDIQSPDVHSITDALKGLTRSETMHGDFGSPRGPNVSATKQVFIESLPPVLIIHLKRFQYDNKGGTQKIWKKIGYPLELEIPKEVFPQQKRVGLVHAGLPKYRLISVVYHHGKNASVGHYTVDLRRQDGREWVRLDDTNIRRLRSEEVAEGGSEENPKVIAATLEAQKKEKVVGSNIFEQPGFEEENEDDGEGWNQVSGTNNGKKSWSKVANETSPPQHDRGKSVEKFSLRDSKVAYILFYQRM